MANRKSWTRREVLQAGAAATIAATVDPADVLIRAADPPLVIDCHAHIYSEDETKYPTIENPYRPPAGTGTIAHLEREMRAAGVKYVTAIQTSTFYKFDNRFTADSSRSNSGYMAGVCTLDPDDPASPKQLEEYAKSYNIRGMRSIPGKSGRLDDPGVDALWSKAERLGIVINVLTGIDHQEQIEALVNRHRKLRVVIDHCLNIKAGPTLEPTVKAMRALAALPTVHAKLSFIPTGSAEDYPFRDMHTPCLDVLKAFGPERCLWGSDFPCELWCPKVTYVKHLRIFTQELGLDEKAQRAILGETAKRLWFSKNA